MPFQVLASAAMKSLTSVIVCTGGGVEDEYTSPVCTADRERRVYKRKVIGNRFFFNFVFHATSLKHFAEEIGALSGLVCATPRMTPHYVPCIQF
jgi:hypothetical protein